MQAGRIQAGVLTVLIKNGTIITQNLTPECAARLAALNGDASAVFEAAAL